MFFGMKIFLHLAKKKCILHISKFGYMVYCSVGGDLYIYAFPFLGVGDVFKDDIDKTPGGRSTILLLHSSL